ncbi:MAG: cation diffusion facilitator family transporter [Candidatus Eremiobacteraeota bacterium]|nr:cation diffusion facilitator family transporter [Candidatus Eremiobacteraeota bacterium]
MGSQTRLLVALILAACVAVLEFWGGVASHSIALTTDAVHVCMDVFALAVALIAAIGAARPATRRKTFGYGRIEILGALFNGALLFAATIVLIYQALLRFGSPVEPHGLTMTVVAAIGLAVNIVIGLTLSHHHHENLNVKAALYHVAGDALGAFAVIVGGVVILLAHKSWIDPTLSLFVAAIIVAGVVRVLRDAADVLLEGAPPGIDCIEVEERIRAIGGIAGVHDLHVWSIATGSHALSAHIVLQDRRISEGALILGELRTVARDRYGIGHVTVQLEAEHCDPGGIIICRTDGLPPTNV